MIAWLVALLNFSSGILLAIPALRLTRDLRVIRNAQREQEAFDQGKSVHSQLIVDRIVENAGELQDRLKRWNLRDTGLLYAGLSTFILASFLHLVELLLKN